MSLNKKEALIELVNFYSNMYYTNFYALKKLRESKVSAEDIAKQAKICAFYKWSLNKAEKELCEYGKV